MDWIWQHPVAVWGTVAVLVAGWLTKLIGDKLIDSYVENPRRHYRLRQLLTTLITLLGAALIGIFWARLLQKTSTFLGLVGAGLAIALREPLLSLAARVAIFAGRIYVVGDRIEIDKMSGDVIDIGFVYTRIMEIGNWISGDQYTGRILQFPNNKIFGAAVFNYTKAFTYVWDEVQLAITYDSNLKAATDILLEVGNSYTHEFLEGAQRDMRRMQRYFSVEDFELKPQVYLKVTTNWVGLTMRYIVHPNKRRVASSYIYGQIFDRIFQRSDIHIGSDTMNVTVEQANAEHSKSDQKKPKRTEEEEEDRAA
jgi:small-conductance mechanosensitive channel